MADERRSERARRMIEEVEDALKTQTPAQVCSQFAEWQKEFPKIFEMIVSQTYNRSFMNVMLEQLDKVERGIVSQHNASIAVGTLLVDGIVKPQLKNAGKKV